MKTRTLAIAALALWVGTIAVAAYLFVNGTTTTASDQRTAIALAPAERDLVLSEMRTMLGSVQGIVAGLSDADRARIGHAAAQSGMVIAGNVPAPLMAKLPLDFKLMGMGVHRGFDEISAAASQDEPTEMVMSRLSDQLARCVGCHARFRIESAPPTH